MLKQFHSPLYKSSLSKPFDSLDSFIEHIDSTNTYHEIFKLARLFKVKIVFSCVELKDSEIDSVCQASPEDLMNQFKYFSLNYKVPIIAENTEMLTSKNFESKRANIKNNLKGFYQFNYMRKRDSKEILTDLTNQSLEKEFIGIMDKRESVNYFRKRKVVLMEMVECSKCANDLHMIKQILKLF